MLRQEACLLGIQALKGELDSHGHSPVGLIGDRRVRGKGSITINTLITIVLPRLGQGLMDTPQLRELQGPSNPSLKELQYRQHPAFLEAPQL